MIEDKFSLILDCAGFKQNNFTLCSGTTNLIIDFSVHIDEIDSKIIDFLNIGCRLFDGAIYDWNKIVNTLKIFHDNYGFIDNSVWESLYMWFPLHKRCGAILKIVFNDEMTQK